MRNLIIGAAFTLVAGATGSFVGVQSLVEAPLAMPDGGPQGLEGYVRLSHDRGTTALAIGTIGNVELNARGSVTAIRSLQSGGVITNSGHVDRWSGLYLTHPRAGLGYTGPVNIARYDYITFDNGWSLRPTADNAALEVCSPQNVCHAF